MTTPEGFIAEDLKRWPLAAENYRALSEVRSRNLHISGRGDVTLVYNPARRVSTAAKVDSKDIAARKCFLCAENRPAEQSIMSGFPDPAFEMLLNPFPICNPHFTIASREHIPQLAPPEAMLCAASQYPELVFFYNGARAGASAPDHLHFQAVLQRELPLLATVEAVHPADKDVEWSGRMSLLHPCGFWSISHPEQHWDDICDFEGVDAETGRPDTALKNVFVWRKADGELHAIVIPRRRHRHPSWPYPMISPGALDVAGIVVSVNPDDYENITPEVLKEIYDATTFKAGSID